MENINTLKEAWLQIFEKANEATTASTAADNACRFIEAVVNQIAAEEIINVDAVHKRMVWQSVFSAYIEGKGESVISQAVVKANEAIKEKE